MKASMVAVMGMASIGLSAMSLAHPGHGDSPNTLSAAEKAAGWRLLFDGKTTANWRGYKKDKFPAAGWVVEDGCLKTEGGKGGGDIITADQYGDFELQLEWKTAPKGNSGIIFRVAETLDTTWQTGPEFQILDDAGHALAPTDPHAAGALYDLAPPAEGKVVKPAGEFNHARMVMQDGVLRHWLNGVKVVDVRTDGDDWKKRIAASKFKGYNGFGMQPRGHIALQEHGDTIWFRNIKVRPLGKDASAAAGEVKLFNGTDLTGLTFFLKDGGKMEDVWSVKDGVLVCTGNPAGYIRTKSDYKNFVLNLDWRFNPVTKQAGNSGVLLRVTGEDKVWPRSVEAQLHSGNAGDFWNIGEVPMKTDPARTNGRNTRKMAAAENPVGEWNHYEIIVDHGKVTLYVNGQLVNEAWDVEEIAGKIALQSEGAEIHFKDIRLTPIE